MVSVFVFPVFAFRLFIGLRVILGIRAFHLYNSLPLLIVGCMRVYVCVCLKVRMYVFMHMSARYMHTYEQIYIHFTHSAGEDDDDTNAIIGSFNNISSSTTQTPSTIAT